MDNNALLLPEPFSEKNIDGSPITKTEEGRSLFRNPARTDRRIADRRAGDRRGGGDRRSDGYDMPDTAQSGQEGLYAPIPEDIPGDYYTRLQNEPDEDYDSPLSDAPGEEPVFEGGKYELPSQEAAFPPENFDAPAPEPVYPEESYEAESYETADPGPSYDPERFDPPVDEKPGMIPNPLKMPPVKKKSGLEYDVDSDYGGYDEGSVYSETPSGQNEEYWYAGDDNGSDYYVPDGGELYPESGADSGEDLFPGSDSGEDLFPGSDNGEDLFPGADSEADLFPGADTEDDGYDEYGSTEGYDSDYDSEYESGSDLSSDYY